MKVLVVGSGAREHAICWKFAHSNRISGLFAAPGNAGTAGIAQNIPELSIHDVEGITRYAFDAGVDLVFVGSPTALKSGLVDMLEEVKVESIGPPAAASRLESDPEFAASFAGSFGIPVKGSEDQTGDEVTLFVLVDESDYLMLPACVDFTRAGVGGEGPATEGMGALSPVPWLSSEDYERIVAEVVAPSIAGLTDAGLRYCGVLGFRLLIGTDGPKLLDYLVRLGDPAAQVLLPLLRADFTNWCEAILHTGLSSFPVEYRQDSAVAVVIAAAGYPGPVEHGLEVSRLQDHPETEALIFHSNTVTDGKRLLTDGDRCFTVVGIGRELLTARSRAYSAARGITFPGSWYRPDIGSRIFGD